MSRDSTVSLLPLELISRFKVQAKGRDLRMSERKSRGRSKDQALSLMRTRLGKESDKAVTMIGSNVTGVQGDIANLGDVDGL